ncbi:unnamed protein product [Rotaria sp. Silwood2]|nr:unnamed protein product [Rotaria sp. Silwood2]
MNCHQQVKNFLCCVSSESIAQHIEHLNAEYLNVVFLKANVEKCLHEVAKYSIRATQTFLFFQHGEQVARLQSTNKKSIEETIKKVL